MTIVLVYVLCCTNIATFFVSLWLDFVDRVRCKARNRREWTSVLYLLILSTLDLHLEIWGRLCAQFLQLRCLQNAFRIDCILMELGWCYLNYLFLCLMTGNRRLRILSHFASFNQWNGLLLLAFVVTNVVLAEKSRIFCRWLWQISMTARMIAATTPLDLVVLLKDLLIFTEAFSH